MKIGLIVQLHGRPGGRTPTWHSISTLAATVERSGFDSFVFEDALLYRGETETNGCWESVSIAAALAATTQRINIGQSVINSPYRSPALMAKIADTIDEISGGRYLFGIGAGNTPDSDYEAFGFPKDVRYSRFAEAIHIIFNLLKTGSVDFEGRYYSASKTELVLRGPRPQGPPIIIAAAGRKMLRLAAQYADGWNWWGRDETLDQTVKRMRPIVIELERACEDLGRDPASLVRTFDLYTVVPEGFSTEGSGLEQAVTGSSEQIAEHILGLSELGFQEVRCDLYPKTPDAVEAMQPVVDLLHAG